MIYPILRFRMQISRAVGHEQFSDPRGVQLGCCCGSSNQGGVKFLFLFAGKVRTKKLLPFVMSIEQVLISVL